jgi:DNA gyrase subunit B
MTEDDKLNLTTDEKLDLILSRLAALEADIAQLKIAESGRVRLADCAEKDPALRELFIVEGDIAGMICKQGRNPRTQAILPLEGKILNVEKARFDKMLSNSELNALITALGAGIGKDYFGIEKLRYHKIILLCDDHVEGSRLRDLLLSFFFRHMPWLLEHKTADGETKSYVYLAQPPFYQVWRGEVVMTNSGFSGSSGQYIKDDGEMNRYLIKKAAEEATIVVKKTGEKLEVPALSLLLEKLLEFNDFYQKLVRKLIDRRLADALLETMIGSKGLMRKDGRRLREIFADENLLGKVQDAFAEAEYKTRLISDDEHALSAIEVKNMSDGSRVLIDWEMATRVEFERAVDLYKSFLQPIPPPYLIREGDLETEVKSRGDLLDYFLSMGQKDLAVQRFENLGEMNPQKIWETALDPEKRTLLQVKIEDAATADERYTVMMGEQAESRSVHAMIGGLSEDLKAVKDDVKEIKRDLKDLARSFNTLAGDGAKLRAALDEIETRVSTLERKRS